MNSRLNRELREKRGYVYTVDSSVSLMTDAGLWAVYFGCDPANVKRCREIIYKEVEALADKRLSSMAFERIKRQYCGQLLVSSDQRENRAMSLAKSLLYYGEIHDIAATAEHIREVTAEELRDTAAMLAGSARGCLTLA